MPNARSVCRCASYSPTPADTAKLSDRTCVSLMGMRRSPPPFVASLHASHAPSGSPEISEPVVCQPPQSPNVVGQPCDPSLVFAGVH